MNAARSSLLSGGLRRVLGYLILRRLGVELSILPIHVKVSGFWLRYSSELQVGFSVAFWDLPRLSWLEPRLEKALHRLDRSMKHSFYQDPPGLLPPELVGPDPRVV